MDPDTVADHIGLHAQHDETWGGWYLDCTTTELATTLRGHYRPDLTGLDRAG